MRVTQRSIALTSLQGLNRNLDAVGKLQEQLTSGRSINKPSDSPTGTNRAMQARSDASAALQHARNISDGTGWLDSTDSALQSMLAQTRRVRDLTVQAANTGALSSTAAESIQKEIGGLREGLLGLANTVVQGRPIFGGVTAGSTAYNADGTFAGRDDSAITRRVSDSEAIRIDITGPAAFGPDGANLFSTLDSIVTNVGNRDADALSADLTTLDAVMTSMVTAAADIGTRASRMETAQQVNADLQLTLRSRSASIENVDLAKTIMDLNMQQTGYQAALQATAQVIQPTLLDFLR
jgi:flagellin-like hook-associated protein FlgL